jgi:hypothetical protein
MLADWKVLLGARRLHWLPSHGSNSFVLERMRMNTHIDDDCDPL